MRTLDRRCDGARSAGSTSPTRRIRAVRKLHLKYDGADSTLIVDFGPAAQILEAFERAHRLQFGFVAPGKPLVVEAISVEAIGSTQDVEDRISDAEPRAAPPPALASVRDVFSRAKSA